MHLLYEFSSYNKQKPHIIFMALCVVVLSFNLSITSASPRNISSQDLLLWRVDPTQIQTIDMLFTDKGCVTVPSFTAGKLYHLKLLNQSGKPLIDPLPQSFISSISIQTVNVAGMRMELSSLDGISINDGSSITLEMIPISSGSWNVGCSKQAIITKASAIPFPPMQPKGKLSSALLKVPKPIGEFSLIHKNEQPFDRSNIKNRWSLLFFGYTSCPDVCPTNLFNLAQAYDQLPASIKDQLDIIFVSVDPERDTPQALNQYVRHFHDDFQGVTGKSSQIAKLADQLSVSYFLPKSRSNKNYEVAHTADYFLLSSDARLVARMNHEQQADEIASTISVAWRYFNQLLKPE